MGRAPATTISAVVFDLGGVLLDWDRRHLYRKLFDDEAEMEVFLDSVCTMDWNDLIDKGMPIADAVAQLVHKFPDQAALIDAYRSRWTEMIRGPIPGTADVLGALREIGIPVFALSNWSRQTFDQVAHEHAFLGWFDGVLLSGDVGITKPDPRIFQLLCERFSLDPGALLFVDDVPANVEAGRSAGLQAVLFEGATRLRDDLVGFGLLH